MKSVARSLLLVKTVFINPAYASASVGSRSVLAIRCIHTQKVFETMPNGYNS